MRGSSLRAFIIVAAVIVAMLSVLVAGLASRLALDNTAAPCSTAAPTPTAVDPIARPAPTHMDTGITREAPHDTASITVQPSNVTVIAGQTARFEVKATGKPPLSYQWQRGGMNLFDATGSSYTTPEVNVADNGSTYSVVVSNLAGTVTSSTVTLTVNHATPMISAAPSSVTTYDVIDVSWAGMESAQQWDYIAMYRVGDSDKDSLSFTYLKSTDSTGSTPFTAPPKPGKYEFRYFAYCNPEKLATSNIVTVTDGSK